MRFVGQLEPAGDAWKKWRAGAIARTKELIAAWRANKPIDVGKYYRHKAAKQELLAIFGGKCAYCEVRLTGAQSGDVEHYRPKSGVRDIHNAPVVHPATGEQHQGYFWFANEWFNLLLACDGCNNLKISTSGVKQGKGERFPLETPHRSFAPDDGVVEQPTLLNPWLDNPEDHLIFDSRTGTIAGTTDRGRATVELLGLNRDGLVQTRKEICDVVRYMYLRLYTAVIEGNTATIDQISAELAAHRKGKEPFSAMTAALMRVLDETITDVVRKTRVA